MTRIPIAVSVVFLTLITDSSAATFEIVMPEGPSCVLKFAPLNVGFVANSGLGGDDIFLVFNDDETQGYSEQFPVILELGSSDRRVLKGDPVEGESLPSITMPRDFLTELSRVKQWSFKIGFRPTVLVKDRPTTDQVRQFLDCMDGK